MHLYTMSSKAKIFLFIWIAFILPVIYSFSPQEARVNQKKIERQREKKQKEAEKEYEKAVKRHNDNQSKATKKSMKQSKKESKKTIPIKR
jgi:hypothetical protein